MFSNNKIQNIDKKIKNIEQMLAVILARLDKLENVKIIKCKSLPSDIDDFNNCSSNKTPADSYVI